ncbi:hypothetical protein NQ176_g1723 [Zarea fungicola]|uniref:Uncharacterized protein n=1 Tax=Zarea fungicola TaxID=93591 RepID=A0ACC1NSY7_9HYPO|nr:hypothetical protein NQ176_g1723 [Lecanicillium fungicola]
MSGEFTAFFYGTLMAPEVFFSVCYGTKAPAEVIQKLHTFTPAILDDFGRHRVLGADYPAIVPEKGQSVRGFYVTGLTDANMDKLNHYEGDEYVLENVQVRLEGDGSDSSETAGQVRDTSVYVFLHPEVLERREWDFEEFRRDAMRFWTRNGYCEADEVGE